MREAAESLVWACAALRHKGARLETAEDGNADQLELAWLCLHRGGRPAHGRRPSFDRRARRQEAEARGEGDR